MGVGLDNWLALRAEHAPGRRPHAHSHGTQAQIENPLQPMGHGVWLGAPSWFPEHSINPGELTRTRKSSLCCGIRAASSGAFRVLVPSTGGTPGKPGEKWESDGSEGDVGNEMEC